MPPAGDMVPPSRTFFRFAAACACLYLAAQVFQGIVLGLFSPAASTPEDAILHRLLIPQRASSIAVLLSFPAVLVAYAGVALGSVRRSPAAAALGLVLASLFVALELAYRSVDLFVVTEIWARDMQETADLVLRVTLTDRVAVWRQVVRALYFPLTFAHGAASACFAVGIWTKAADRLTYALSALLALNAARALGRIVEMHLGVQGLGAVNLAVYFPVTIALFGVMAVWLWTDGRTLVPE